MAGVKLEVWGDLALFTRVDSKSERASYPVITPSAARAIVEAVLWRPAIRFSVNRIHVLNPIRFLNIRRNELGSKISKNSAASVMKSGGGLATYIESDRQQRAAMMLQDVHYVIEATFDVLDSSQHPGKFLAMFERRAKNGQCGIRPYLGTRECDCHFAWCKEIPTGHYSNLAEHDFGMMLHDLDYSDPSGPVPHFFHAQMRNGVIDVPKFPQAKATQPNGGDQ